MGTTPSSRRMPQETLFVVFVLCFALAGCDTYQPEWWRGTENLSQDTENGSRVKLPLARVFVGSLLVLLPIGGYFAKQEADYEVFCSWAFRDKNISFLAEFALVLFFKYVLLIGGGTIVAVVLVLQMLVFALFGVALEIQFGLFLTLGFITSVAGVVIVAMLIGRIRSNEVESVPKVFASIVLVLDTIGLMFVFRDLGLLGWSLISG